jgi:hypothetical protein
MFDFAKTARTALIGSVMLATASGAALAGKFSDDGAQAPAPAAQVLEVTFINDYSSPLWYLYATNVNDENWGKDHLGEYTVETGWQITIDLEDASGQCLFDIRAEFADGSVVEDWSVDVCEVNEVTYYEI